MQKAILDASLAHIPTHGWTTDALAAGAKSIGLSPASHGAIIQYDLVSHVMNKATAEMISHLDHHKCERIRAFTLDDEYRVETAKAGLMARVKYLSQHFGPTWAQAMALAATPAHIQTTAVHLTEMADEILFRCRDRSTGFGWYAKRSAVLAIHAAAELHMLGDSSNEGFEATEEFIYHRVAEAAKAWNVVKNSEDAVRAAALGLLTLTVTPASTVTSSTTVNERPITGQTPPTSASSRSKWKESRTSDHTGTGSRSQL